MSENLYHTTFGKNLYNRSKIEISELTKWHKIFRRSDKVIEAKVNTLKRLRNQQKKQPAFLLAKFLMLLHNDIKSHLNSLWSRIDNVEGLTYTDALQKEIDGIVADKEVIDNIAEMLLSSVVKNRSYFEKLIKILNNIEPALAQIYESLVNPIFVDTLSQTSEIIDVKLSCLDRSTVEDQLLHCLSTLS